MPLLAVTNTCLLDLNQRDGVIRPLNKIFSGKETNVASPWHQEYSKEDVQGGCTDRQSNLPWLENWGRGEGNW
jgi:hypothetical protein